GGSAAAAPPRPRQPGGDCQAPAAGRETRPCRFSGRGPGQLDLLTRPAEARWMDVPTLELRLHEPLVGLLNACPGVEIADGVFGGGGYMAEAADMLPYLRMWRNEGTAQALSQLEQLIDRTRAHVGYVEVRSSDDFGWTWPTARECEA